MDVDMDKIMEHARELDVEDRKQVVITPVEDHENLCQRLDYELSVIHSMGFVAYFLIVWDFINWAKDNDVATSSRSVIL